MNYQAIAKYFPWANAAYGKTDANPTPIPVGASAPVVVQRFTPTPDSGFDGALYKDSTTGKYVIAFAGSVQPGADWLGADPVLGAQRISSFVGEWAGSWHPQMTDALNFAYAAVKQIRDDLILGGVSNPTMDQIRAKLEVTGHSLGGALAEMVAKFYGLSGANIDGPGVTTLVGLSDFTAAQDRVAADTDLAGFQRNYTLAPGAFTANAFSIVGMAGTHLSDTGFEAEDKASTSFYVGATLVVLGGFSNPLMPLAGLGILGNSGLDHPMGAILGKLEAGLNLPSLGSLPLIDSVGLGAAPVGGLGTAPQLALYEKTPSVLTFAVAAKWVADTQTANVAAGQSPSGLVLNGMASEVGDYLAIAFRDPVTLRINEIYTPISGGTPIKREFVVSADGQVGTFTVAGKLQFLIPGANGEFGLAELQPNNKMLFTSFATRDILEMHGYTLDASTAASLREGGISIKQNLEDTANRIFEGNANTSLTLGSQTVQATQLERDGLTYNLDANGNHVRSLDSGVVDLIDSQGNRFLQDANGQRIPVGTNQTISLSDAGIASVVARPKIDETGIAGLPQVIEFGESSDGTRFDLNATGLLQTKVTFQAFDDGSRIELIHLVNGTNIQKSYDTDHTLAGTITDTPDGQGGINRSISTAVDGKPVVINQHVDAAALAIDKNHDGNLIDAGDAVTTGLTISGTAAVNSDLVAHAIDDSYQSAIDIIRARGTGPEKQLITAGDSSVATGYQSAPTTGGSAWYESEGAQQLGGTLTGIQSLIASLKTGRPLPIATDIFNLAATVTRNPELGQIGQGLSTLNSLSSFAGALERGDELAALSSGATFVNSVYVQFYKEAVTASINTLGGIEAATKLAESGNEAAANLVQTQLIFQNIAKAIPFLNLINALDKGDTAGALSAIGFIAGYPVIGWALAILSIANSLFQNPDIHGSAQATSSQDGIHATASITSNSENAGTTAASVMTNLIHALESTFADTVGMGIIAQRLPSLYFKGFGNSNGYFDLTFHDASTGQGYVRHYSADGDYLGTPQWMVRNSIATETIAGCAINMRARGRFDLKIRIAKNDATWGIAA